jgi:GTP-binding protein
MLDNQECATLCFHKMAKLPTVAIIGRPNTGKSTLFNRLVGRRRAIVSETPGTTRDPIASRMQGEKLDYLLMDTGGMGGGTEDADFEDDVHAQSLLALEFADLILFIVNSREDLTSADHKIVDALRKKRRSHVSVFLVISKCDDVHKVEELLPQFYDLGIADQTFPVSAFHGIGMDELEEGIEERLIEMHFGDDEEGVEEDDDIPRVAFVGKPNVGKSSLLNALMSPEEKKTKARLVSDVPGTTRDTTDTVIKSHGKDYLFLDTAGMKKKRADEEIEAFAALRTLQTIEGADITVLVIDATEEISRQDKRIANLTIERGAGLILLVNKTDLLSEEQMQKFNTDLQGAFAFCRWAPVLYTSAETREHLPKLFELITMVCENRQRRIATPVINRWFQDITAKYQPKGIGGKTVKTKYVTQVEIAPPTFALFLKDPKRFHFSSLRFMENKLRESYALEGTPVRWVKKGKE